MQIYSKSQKMLLKNFISQPILIWFALSHRANWGLQNLYTEFQNVHVHVCTYLTVCISVNAIVHGSYTM